MPSIAATVDWADAQAAVARAYPRLTALLRTVRTPDAPAIGDWSITELTIHVSHAMDAVSAVAKGGGGLLDDVWGLAGMSNLLVEAETERDLTVLADRIDASVAGFLDYMRTAPADTTQTWLVQGVQAPLSLVTCHVLNELVVHGRDIALAAGQKWPIDRPTAALIVSGFVLPVLGSLGRAMVADAGKAKRITYDLKVRGGGRFQLGFDGGEFSATPGAPTGSVDCHLSVDPEAFLLVSWNRISQWNAIPKGKLMAWGRKPWVGLQLRSLLKNP